VWSLEAQDSFVNYINQMRAFTKHYKEHYNKVNDKTDSFQERSKKMLALLDNFDIYREPSTIEEKRLVRWYYATKFFWVRKTSGDYSKSIHIGLLGTKYAVDPILLDESANNIELIVGHSYARLDDFSRAILYYKKCIPGFQDRKDFKRLARLYSSIGDMYILLKEYEKANDNFQKGIVISKQIKCNDCFLANHTGLYKIAYVKNNKKLFLELSAENRMLLKAQNNSPKIESRIAELNDALGIYYFNEQEYSKALSYFKKVKEHKKKNHKSKLNRDIAKISLKIAQCHLALNNTKGFRSEIEYCNQLLILNSNGFCPNDSLLYAENTFLKIYELTSNFYLEQYYKHNSFESLDSSLIFLRKVVKVSELLDKRIIYSKAKSNFANEAKEYLDKAIETAYLIHQKDGEQLDKISWIRELFNASKDQILDDKIKLRHKIEYLTDQNKKLVDSLVSVISSELGKANYNKNKVLECQDRIDKLTGSQIKLKNRTALKGDYLEYLITKDNLFLLSEMNGQLTFLKLGTSKQLETLINSFNEKIKQKHNYAGIDSILIELGNFLLPEPIFLSKKFTIIPDQNITTIPFDLLKIDGKYLIENHTTSISTHYLQKTKINYDQRFKIFCVNPEYKFQSNIPNEDVDRSGFYPLPFALSEIKSIRSLFSSSFEVENKSVPATVPLKLKDANIFHFTGHAKVNQDSAYLVLNGPDGITKWTNEQIYHNNFNLDLVTLSACETGLGEVQYGDGLNSVARSFLGTGADAVVYSLWTVNDMSTTNIMEYFYTELKNGSTKNEALRQAKLKYLNNASPENRHPYYWGGFVAAGNMASLNISTEISPVNVLLVSLIILPLIILIYKTLKTKQQ